MNKKIIAIICAIVVVAALVVCGVLFLGGSSKTSSVTLETTEDFSNLIDKIYDKTNLEMFGLETREIELDDEYAIQTYTGLSSANGIDKVVVNESMITSAAYSVTMVKVSSTAYNIAAMKQEMLDNIDMRRWICVGADVVYVTSSNDVIFLVMGDEETAKAQIEAFQELTGEPHCEILERQADVIDFDFDETVQ